jgi:predicted dehydrogenase/threonine dehydrogenase-like Zn-dependent dehydrogenase
MKQLLQNMKTGKTTVEDVPIPVPAGGQALVRVAASLVSAGTERMVVEFAEKSLLGKARSRPDLVRQVLEKARREGVISSVRSAFNRLDQPMALGYSSAGTIAALGEDMPGFRIGQRVACAGGGYAVHAEYNLVPRALLTPLPDGVDFESAAFTTLGAIALHGFRLADQQIGESTAVIGLGLLGLLAGQIAAAAGCRVLGIDTNPGRVALAASLGILSVGREQAEERSRSFTAGRGFDAVLICADTPASDPVELAALIARDRARIVATGAVGLTLPRKIYYEKELSFINSRSYGPGRYDPAYEEGGRDYPLGYVRWTEGRNFEAVVGLLADGSLKAASLITHRFPIERAAQAYELITGQGDPAFLGVLLTYAAEESSVGNRVNLSPPRPSGGPVRLGVLGAGLFANATLLPVLRTVPGIELVGIASAAGLHAQQAGKKYGFAYAAASVEEILNDPAINAVAILTRHDTHADLVARALQAGKHVFVEKPLAIDSPGLERVLAALMPPAEQGQLPPAPGILAVGFNRRFAPLAVELADFLSSRSEPLYMHYRINAGALPLTHWTQDPVQSGGRIIGEGCHFVDFLTFLTGAAPLSVSGRALPDEGKYREDNASLTFTFPDGSLGVVDYLANGDKSFPKERLEVFCGGRVAVLDDFRSLETILSGRRRLVKHTQDKGWKEEWIAFAGSIRTGGLPPIPYSQLVGVTRATFAAVEALRTRTSIDVLQDRVP